MLTGFCACWKKGRFVTGFSLGGCRVQRAFRKGKKTFLSRSLRNVKMVRTPSSLIKLKMKNRGFDWVSAVSRLMLNSVSLWVGIILLGLLNHAAVRPGDPKSLVLLLHLHFLSFF